MNHKKRLNRKKLKVISLVAVPLVAGLGAVAAQPALAGTNGQQIRLCQPGSDYQTAEVTGVNQDGNTVTQSFNATPRSPLEVSDGAHPCRSSDGFFWKGDVKIIWSNPKREIPDSSSLLDPQDVPDSVQSTCTVPVDSADDLFLCSAPNIFFP
jgi:hypothetical protein